jgi:hypothetical protein
VVKAAFEPARSDLTPVDLDCYATILSNAFWALTTA